MSTDQEANGHQTQEANGEGKDTSNQSEQSTQDVTTVENPEAVLKKNRELLSKLKQTQEKFNELQERLTEKEQQELAASGKKDELIESLKSQLKDRESKLKETTQSFALKTVNSQVLDMARDLGCVKPDKILKLADLSAVQVGEDFTVDRDALKSAIEQVREEIPELFKKQVSAPRDGVPGKPQVGESATGKSIAELQELYKKAAMTQPN